MQGNVRFQSFSSWASTTRVEPRKKKGAENRAMTYPKEFPPEARAAVEAEMILGRRNYSKVKQASDNARSVRAWILSVFLVYGRQAIDLGTQRVWTVDKVLAEALEGLRLITIEVAHQTGFEYWVENWDGSVKSDVMSEF